MPTNVIIIGQVSPTVQTIEFIKFLNGNYECVAPRINPSSFKNIELICRNYKDAGFDLMFAYNDKRNEGSIYFGRFNDGIVE